MAKSIKELLPTFLHDESWQRSLLRNWPTIIGEVHTKVRLEKIEGDTLVLGVYDACWLQELYLLTPLLLTTINQNLDQPRIKHLRFKRSVAKKNSSAPQPVPKPTTTYQLTDRQQQTLATIKDEQLRNALRNFLIRCNKEHV